MEAYPEDFSFEYRWQMGSVPPPYYYEYTIKISSDGAGEIELLPDYPIHNPIKRTASLSLNRDTMEYMYEEMRQAGLFEKECQVVDSNWIGGSQSSLKVHADGVDINIPYAISSADVRRLEPIYLMIQELIPSNLLNGLPG